MLLSLPLYIPILFALTMALAVWLLYRATNHNRTTLAVLLGWMALQAIQPFAGFYQRTDIIPPRLALLIGPPLVVIISLFFSKKGQTFIDRARLDQLTLLHSVRIVVEVVLLLLFIHKAVPKAMTFERSNFDTLAGLTAPLVYYLAFVRKKLSRRALLVWNYA